MYTSEDMEKPVSSCKLALVAIAACQPRYSSRTRPIVAGTYLGELGIERHGLTGYSGQSEHE
jgi:hypothetical protein